MEGVFVKGGIGGWGGGYLAVQRLEAAAVDFENLESERRSTRNGRRLCQGGGREKEGDVPYKSGAYSRYYSTDNRCYVLYCCRANMLTAIEGCDGWQC